MVLVMMMTLDWQLTLMALVPMPFISIIVYRLGKLVHKKFEERQEKYSELTTRAQETCRGSAW
jgi:ATP-binding cassette subfamily B protein